MNNSNIKEKLIELIKNMNYKEHKKLYNFIKTNEYKEFLIKKCIGYEGY